MRKLLSILLVLIMIISTLASCSQGSVDDPETPETNPPAGNIGYADRDVTGRNVATVKIKIKDHGTMTLLLDATSAPRTVANFLTLAKSGFYDGTTFYSAQQIDENSAVFLAGDPTIYGGESSGEMIYGEFSMNGYSGNDLLHKRGVISMYHSNNSANDAESCFFISNADITYLDGYYAPFGYITDGFSVLDSIMEMGLYYTDPQTGLVLKSRQPVITSITVVKDIDYSLVSDVYIAPPTADELSQVLGEDAEPKKVSTSFAPESVLRAYKTESGCALQITKKSDGKLTNILVSVDKNGSIIKAIDLPLSRLDESVSLDSLTGLGIDGIDATELPDEIKSLAKDVVRSGNAVNADGSASKYIYVRDTEGHETYTVEMKMKDYDTPVIILLDKTTAPITVANFVSLVEKGFYDGLDFHRIIKGFMIQGGDDSHLPEEEQAASIKGEFASNGVENDIKHLRGTISMARTSVKDSASSGFFICDADSYWLDGEYAAFGYVISGMETVDAIADYADGKTDSNGNLNSGVEQPTIEYIKIIENVAGE